VVDAAGEAFDYPGLYVTDGSVIPSSLAVNTSLTILANAERIAAGIARRYRAS
jgi:cholesterol oxidase